jgi:hypothetical protein
MKKEVLTVDHMKEEEEDLMIGMTTPLLKR